jgi:hypothetical protein
LPKFSPQILYQQSFDLGGLAREPGAALLLAVEPALEPLASLRLTGTRAPA